ncbi:MAG: zinc-dependent alcohol dehydrogenase family protein [Anaerolineales bacterium]
MRAAVFYGARDLRIEEREGPRAGEGEVVVEVLACGICGTDRHIYHGQFAAKPPVVPGHEYTGRIVEVGKGVSGLAVDDHVAIDPNIHCGACRFCRRGDIHLCENLSALGVDMDGGFAELAVAPSRQCYLLPDSVSPLEGALAEPLACCVHGIDLAEVGVGDRVAVIGGGLIGQMLAQLARLRGAGYLVLSDPIVARREMALSLGVDAVIDPTSSNALQETPLGEGADVVIEAVGSAQTAVQAIEWAAPGGTIVWFGVAPPGDTVDVEPNLVFRKELTIRGSLVNPHTHGRALALLASEQVDVAPLITRTIGLDALLQVLSQGPDEEIKTVVTPTR